MSSLQGYIEATYDELVKAFGEPAMGPNGDGDKVTCEWEIELDNQTFYIYDWKEEETPMGRYMWHIGGTTRDAERIVQEAFDNPRTGPYARMSNRELA